MNVAIWLYKLGNGGAERVVADLASSFTRRDNNVTILTHTNEGDYRSSINDKVTIQNLGTKLPQFLKPKTFFCLYGLVRFIKNEQPDIVFTTGLQHSVILLFLSRLFRFSSKIVIRETNTISIQSKLSQNALDRMSLWLAKRFYPYADQIIAPSKGVAKDLIEHIPHISTKLEVIPNPVDFEAIQTSSQKPLPEEHITKPYILAVGRLVPQKGHLDLIKAWVPIYQERGIELMILGDGPERDKLIQCATEYGVEDGLHLPGFDANPFRYMQRCDAFVLSSYYEGLPNTLLQALACGCKIVATDCPSGPDEILQEGKLGALVPVGDIPEMRKAIEQQLDRSRNDVQGKQDIIKTWYHKDKVSERYLCLFERIRN